jgi:energy-coupling factor transporter transmembrane protein EcfT
MINQRDLQVAKPKKRAAPQLNTVGNLTVFTWSLGMVTLAPAQRLYLAAALCLGAALVVYPLSLRRMARLRWLVLMALLALPPVFFLSEPERSFLGLGYSDQGLLTGMQIATRMLVFIVALDGLTSTVDIASLAGLLERVGLRGLGFSMGVALNLYPALQASYTNAWHSLRMRGGLRKQRWRGLRLLLITVIANALRRADEIALAAEARAFCPQRCRPMPLKTSSLDWLSVVLGVLVLLGFCLLPL